MKNKIWILIAVLIIASIGGFFYFFTAKNPPSFFKNFQAQKLSANQNTNLDNDDNNSKLHNTPSDGKNITNEHIGKNSTANNSTNNIKKEEHPKPSEKQISTFSTKIYSTDAARQNNISITCNKLNNTIVKKGDIFSFCKTIGPASSDKGYQKADIFDHDGNKKKGLGGGNCQVSSTLYNALLTVPSLVVTERHEHSKSVPYVAKNKDAAVAYGGYDLKFRNNSETDLKITCSTDGKSVVVNLLSLTY